MAINLIRYFAISILGLILFFTTSGYSIRCWVCNSKFDPHCGDPFNNSTLPTTDCAFVSPRPPQNLEVKFTVCGKIVQKLDNNETIIHRTCAQEGEGSSGQCSVSQLSSYGKIQNCSTCSTNFCNSA